MNEKLSDWLASKDRDASVLAQWCQGEDVPYSAMEEPWLWIVEAIPRGPAESSWRSAISFACADLLQRLLSGEVFGSRHDQLWYNLLKLCGELNSPDELCGALRQVLDAGLPGEFREVPLYHILLHALAHNQADADLRFFWRELLQWPEDVPRYLAFSGCVMMPASDVPDDRGVPDKDAIGFALKWMAVELEERDEKLVDFRSLIREVRDTHPGWTSFDEDILSQASTHHWPEWAVECAPSLYLRRPGGTAFIWTRLAAAVPEQLHFDVRNDLCGGVVLEVYLNGALEYISQVAPVVERFRRTETRASNGAMQGAVVDGLLEAERQGLADPVLIKQGRVQFLQKGNRLLSLV